MSEALEAAPIQEILDAVGVKRVVAIDDMYADRASVADAITAINAVPPEVAAEILKELPEVDFSGDPEVRDQLIRKNWPQIEPARQVKIIEELRTKTSEQDDTDKFTKDTLERIFSPREFMPLSLAGWNARKDEVLKDKSLVLILVDEDFSKEGGTATQGLDLVREVLQNSSAENAFCALLSHKYTAADVPSQWEKLCSEQGFDKSRFVLIPKATIDEDPASFARGIKLATIAKPIDEMRELITDILLGALGEAADRLKQIGLYDMDEIVFRSSWKEGVWEPETLLRVFALFHRIRYRTVAMANDDLHQIASRVRSYSQIATDSPNQPEHKIWSIQRLEVYEDALYINSLHLPIELGDIFTKDGGKRFILIAPPCDLMVRSKGQRADSITEVILAEITDESKGNVTWELPHFAQSEKHYVDFKKAFSVQLVGLDLCAFNDDGVARLEVGRPAPKNLIPTWASRYAKLQEHGKTLFDKVEKLKPANEQAKHPSEQPKLTNEHRTLIERSLARIDNNDVFAPILAPSTKILKYNLKRVERLLSPRSQALLTAYAAFLARSDFDHDLERSDESGRSPES